MVYSGKKQGKANEKDVKKVKVDADLPVANIKASAGKGSKKSLDAEEKETEDIKNVEQRVRPLSLYTYTHHFDTKLVLTQ